MSMLEAALTYLRRGWSVIPLQPRGKIPLVEWVTYQERLPTEEEVRNWWHHTPDANIGVVTGRVSGLVVVDLDPARGADVDQESRTHPTGLSVRTGSGGAHLYYRYPSGQGRVSNAVGKGGRDVRADGGQVVVPPSVHASGGVYSWNGDGPPSAVPAWVAAGAAGPASGDRASGPADPTWLSSLLRDGVAHGGRNDAAARLAGYLANKAIPVDVAIAVVSSWNAKNVPPLPESELRQTVDSVYRTHTRRAVADEPVYQHAVEQSRLVSGDSPFTLMAFDQYMSRFGDQDVAWLVEGWMPESTIAFSISPPGTYKTWTLLDLCVSVASGMPFLGHFKVNNPGPVVIIQQEDYHGQTVERLATISRSKFGLVPVVGGADDFNVSLPPPLPIYVHPDRLLRFADPKIMQAFATQIERIRPRLVVLDPLYSAADSEDYMAKAAQQMFILKNLRDRTGCAFLLAHHTKKGAEGTTREGGWGSQFLNAFLETGWQIRPEADEGVIRVRRHFKVSKNAPEIQVTFDINTSPVDPHFNVTWKDAPADGQVSVEQILNVLSESLDPMTISGIADELKVHRSTVSRKVKALVEAGKIIKEGKGLRHANPPQF